MKFNLYFANFVDSMHENIFLFIGLSVIFIAFFGVLIAYTIKWLDRIEKRSSGIWWLPFGRFITLFVVNNYKPLWINGAVFIAILATGWGLVMCYGIGIPIVIACYIYAILKARTVSNIISAKRI